MDPPYAPPEGYASEPINFGPPSWERWAGLDDPSRLVPGPSPHKYFGGCLANFRFVVQNRRKDDKPVLVLAAHSRLVGVVGSSEVLLRGKGEIDNIDIFQNTR